MEGLTAVSWSSSCSGTVHAVDGVPRRPSDSAAACDSVRLSGATFEDDTMYSQNLPNETTEGCTICKEGGNILFNTSFWKPDRGHIVNRDEQGIVHVFGSVSEMQVVGKLRSRSLLPDVCNCLCRLKRVEGVEQVGGGRTAERGRNNGGIYRRRYLTPAYQLPS